MPKDKHTGWFNRRTMAEIFDCTPAHFDEAIRPLAGPDDQRQVGQERQFHARSVMEAWAAAGRSKRKASVTSAEEKELQPEAGASPGLERFRMAKAELAELDLAVKKSELVSRSDMRDCLAQVSTRITEAADELQRRFGPEAFAVLEDCMADAKVRVGRVLAELKAADEGKPQAIEAEVQE